MRLASCQCVCALALSLLLGSLGVPRSSTLLAQSSPVPPESASASAPTPDLLHPNDAPTEAKEEKQVAASEAAGAAATSENSWRVRVRRSNAYDLPSSAEERVALMRRLIALRAMNSRSGDSDEESVEERRRQKRYRFVDPLMNGFYEEDKRKRAMPYVDPLMSGFYEEDKRAVPYVDPLMSGFYEEDKRAVPYVDPLMSGFYEEDRRKRGMSYVDPLMNGFYEEDKRAMPYVDPLMSGFFEEDRRKRHAGSRHQ